MRRVQIEVPLSHLVAGKRNPRRVKPSRDAHHRLTALIRSQGLIHPLVVRPIGDKPKHFEVIAGKRRLAALREVHRGDGNPKIPCVVRDVDGASADALALGENFGREPMHPLDEAEAFAKLASEDGKGADVIAADFGVPEQYVRQRMKLAVLAPVVKSAYRADQINTAMAEAFASVPEDRQVEVWQEVGGNPRHAEHVRNVIANAWIDAKHALFDLSALPTSAVSCDLFSERVLIDRRAFMDAQTAALDAERQRMVEEGWSEVVVGRREDVQDRLYVMDVPEREFDPDTARKLAKLADRREKLEAAAEQIEENDDARRNRIQQRFEKLEEEEHEIVRQAPAYFSEDTKAVATVFLILAADGTVQREYRIPRQRARASSNGNGHAGGGGTGERAKPPTSDELAEKQLAATFTHQALAVREALLKNVTARKRVLALILHEKVRSEALAVRYEPNGTTLHASDDGFKSAAFDALRAKRAKLDPFIDKHHVEDREAYDALREVSASKPDSLIELLTVECLTAHMLRRTELVTRLADELGVNVRDHWRPDAAWLASFQKIQLAHLITELRGPAHAPAPERKKSELVEVLAKLFADAGEGRLEDKKLAERVNRWMPVNLRRSEGQ